MKKLLFSLFSLLLLAACSQDKDAAVPHDSAAYMGSLIVTSNTTPDEKPFNLTNIRFVLEEANGQMQLVMNDIRFAAAMPMSLTIVIPNIEYTRNDNIITLTSSVTPITPLIGGKPYEAFKITDFKGSIDDMILNISFSCENPQIPMGGSKLNHKAQYTGILTK